MTAYISVSFSKRHQLDLEITTIKDVLQKFEILPDVFVDNYKFDRGQEREMMNHAMAVLDACDLLIAETSDKGIGIGIEVGYAKAKRKPIVYIRNTSAEHSTTVSGISDYHILYNDPADLQRQLFDVLSKLAHDRSHTVKSK